jgi:hypothetical protein
LATIAVGLLAMLALSGGSSSDPGTPAGLPGLPPPFQPVAVVGAGGLTAGIDAYGDVVELRAPGPAGRALIDNPVERQMAGSVPVRTGIVPRASIDGGPPRPLWTAEAVRQRYVGPDSNVLRTTARFAGAIVEITCAAGRARLACVSGHDRESQVEVAFDRNLAGGGRRVRLDDTAAARVVGSQAVALRAWSRRALPLAPKAPGWAQEMYVRSLLVLRALTDRRSGAVAAGARDGWAYVWPRDAGAVALALASAGYRPEARRVARFLLGLDLDAAARFDGSGRPVPGRDAQGDGTGWALVAARAAGLDARSLAAGRRALGGHGWEDRADYQEGPAGDYLGNAIASTADGPKTSPYLRFSARRRMLGPFLTRRGLVRTAGAGLDSAAGWAVRPFPLPSLLAPARRTLLTLAGNGGRFGILPSEDWTGGRDPWSAPTAWSAWSLAALSRHANRPSAGARDRLAAIRLLGDLRRAATPAGLLPERVDARSGVPRSTTPLAWSHAFAVLALRELWP